MAVLLYSLHSDEVYKGKNMRKTLVLACFLLSLIVIVLGFSYVKMQAENRDDGEVVVELPVGETVDGISVDYYVGGSWENPGTNLPYAAEYDLKISNRSSNDLMNWKLTIKLPEKYRIEGLWNGIYSIGENDILVIAPEDYNRVIPSKESIPVGFIIDSEEKLEFGNLTFSCQFKHKYTKTTGFKLCVVMSVVWGLAMLVFLALIIQQKMYAMQRHRQENIIVQTMNVISSFVDAKDTYTNGHSKRVAYYTRELARRMKLEDTEVDNFYYAAMLHDCGKIIVPDHILNKEERLTRDESAMMMNHTISGGDALKNVTIIPEIREGALYHHERYDGTGYPEKLKGEGIPLVARVICIADSVDAMYTDRCYRESLSKEEIIKELIKNSGTQFDPLIVPYMINMIEDGFVDSYESSNEDKI